MDGQDAITPNLNRAIAYEKAADGLAENPWLSPIFREAFVQIRASAIEQGHVSAEEWDQRKGYALRLSQVQADALASSDTEQTEAEIDPRAIATLASIYGARVGWERRMGPMPDLDALHPEKMMGFLKVQKTIEGDDEGLSDRAERLYQDLVDQGVKPDQEFARVVQAQYEQFQAMSEAGDENASLNLLTALDSSLVQPHAEVLTPQADSLVGRTADTALGWLYHIGSNHYESDANTFDWDPETQQLTIEGEVSLNVQRQGEQWEDLGSDVNEDFAQRLESHLRAQSRSKPSKAGQSR